VTLENKKMGLSQSLGGERSPVPSREMFANEPTKKGGPQKFDWEEEKKCEKPLWAPEGDYEKNSPSRVNGENVPKSIQKRRSAQGYRPLGVGTNKVVFRQGHQNTFPFEATKPMTSRPPDKPILQKGTERARETKKKIRPG